MGEELTFLLNHCAAAAFDKQLYLNDLVGKLGWRFDLSTGLLSFGTYLQWQTQILGTESEIRYTWLWAWANSTAGMPDHLLEMVRQLPGVGEEHHIREFTEAEFPLQDIDGHSLAMVASMICEAGAYFRAPYDGGAVFLLIKDKRYRREILKPLERVLTVFPQVIAAVEIPNHDYALAQYLKFYGIEPLSEGNTLVVKKENQPILTASFDHHHRLIELQGVLRDQV